MQCKVYAFHCFSACANVFPPLGILYALPRRFSTASCPPPSPPTKEKDEERGWSRWKVVGGRVGGRGGYGWRGWVKVMLGWCEGGARLQRGWSDGGMKGGVWRRWSKIDTKYKDTSTVFIHILCAIHSLGFSPSLFTFPRLFLFSPPLHPSTVPSPLNTLIPRLKRMLGAESVERSEQGWKAERIKWSWGDGRGHDEELGGGRSERQMDGEKEHVH